MDLYREKILDLYRNPVNAGTIANPDIDVYEVNQLCGDVIGLHLKVKNGKIFTVKFQGQGCAVSLASASTLTEMIKGLSLYQAQKLTSGELLEALGINPNPNRLKCALLSLEALRRGIKEYGKKD